MYPYCIVELVAFLLCSVAFTISPSECKHHQLKSIDEASNCVDNLNNTDMWLRTLRQSRPKKARASRAFADRAQGLRPDLVSPAYNSIKPMNDSAGLQSVSLVKM